MALIKFPLLTFLTLYFIRNVYALSCPDNMYRVKEHYRQAHYRNGSYVEGVKVSSYCKHYRSDGPLQTKFHQRMPKTWPKKNERFKKCLKKNQGKIEKALSELPEILTNIGRLKIYCANRSVYPSNLASVASKEKIIVFYDLVFSKGWKQVLAHELAHILYDRLSKKEKKELYKVSLWKESEGKFSIKRKRFSEPDGSNDIDEDFANNIEHYLFENKTFKKSFPKINEWIKKIMGDT